MKKNILIFGGSGLIGSELCNSAKINHEYQIFNLDIKTLNKKNFFKVDTSKANSIHKTINLIERKYGPIHGSVNITFPKVLQRKDPPKIDVKLFTAETISHISSYLNTTQILADYFVKKKIKGKIINFDSIYGNFIPRFEIYKKTKMNLPLQYVVSKNSILMITKYFAKFYLKNKININCISPGGIFDYQDKKFISNYSKHCASGMLKSSDLNGLIFFLLSSESNKISGQNLIIDDGFTL